MYYVTIYNNPVSIPYELLENILQLGVSGRERPHFRKFYPHHGDRESHRNQSRCDFSTPLSDLRSEVRNI